MASTDMREPTFLVLSSLAGGRRHGYAIISDADAASDGRVTLKAGTLYTALERLTNEGLGAGARRQQANARQALARLSARAIRPVAAQ